MENNCLNLKETLKNYYKKRISIEIEDGKFDNMMILLDNQYKLSDIYDFDVDLVVDREHHNKYYRFNYTLNSFNEDNSTTVYICFVYNDTNPENIGIVFNEVTISNRDYPYGKTSTFLLDGTILIEYYDYNNCIDVEENKNYIKKLIKL